MGHETKEFNQNVVVLGGGTGPFNLLRGLVKHNNPALITASPTKWDSGGNTGYLRTELGLLPRGDARRQLIALIPDPQKMEIVRKMYEHRISLGGEKHAIGNLELAVLDQLSQGQGIQLARTLYDVESQILDPSLEALDLFYKVKHEEFHGEHTLDERADIFKRDPSSKISSIYFGSPATANPMLIEAVQRAQKIIFSSGSLYGSVLPFLLIPELRKAIDESDAEVYLDLNVMTEPGQTDGFVASNHVSEFNRYMRNPNRLNYLIAHVNHISKEVLDIYKEEGQVPVQIDEDQCKQFSPRLVIVKGRFASYLEEVHLIRHDPDAIALVHLDTPRYLTQAA